MARRSDSSRFRAKAVRLPWATLAARQRALLNQVDPTVVAHRVALAPAFDDRQLQLRSLDIHLSWACGPALGVPRGPFTVWVRDPKDSPKRTRTTVSGDSIPFVTWGPVEAGCVRVTCRPLDASSPVAVYLFRTGDDADHAVAAGSVQPVNADPLSITVRTSGATYAKVWNGTDITVAIQPLADIVEDPSWQPLEVVGLPVDQPNAGFEYDTSDQGPIATPMTPVDAAVHRLLRGGPPIGWGPVTEAGRLAPPWAAPDPKLLVEEVRRDLFPELPPMYDLSVREYQQFAVTSPRAVDPPQQDGKTSSLTTQADTGPWPMLMLPALSDPFLNLATGFGASYTMERFDELQVPVGHCDFLVTARYSRLAPPARGGAEFAAYAPAPEPHLVVPTPTALLSERAGLVGPITRDAAWRESIRLTWDRVPKNAAASPVTESALARYELTTSGAAQSLLPRRDAGGDRPLLISPDGSDGNTGFNRVALVDGGQEIPIGSGGRHVGYAVAVSDVHGVWSPWRDVLWDGTEPAPQPTRLISVALDTHYAGSSNCPGTLKAEVAVEWLERTPTQVEIVALYFPMAAATDVPPVGMSPSAPTPTGCFRRDLGFTFTGDTPVPSGCTVRPLSADGTEAVTPGPGQGDGGRRYAVQADVPSLDFGSTNRWGVQVWARRHLLVGTSPTPWSPVDPHPARTSAASPVPVVPLPPPPLPGVPLGSTIDAQGCSHVRVAWSLPGGADVRTCIVWEVNETSLRQRAGLPARAPDSTLPGQRLVDLRTAYDAMTPTQRRASFRRLVEVDGAVRSHDVTLPKGSNDIHLFVVTTMTKTGIESPWPSSGTPHEHFQAVMAPRLRRPAPPVARPSIAADGTVTISLYAASSIAVQRFRIYRTTSDEAARDVSTMGPAFADVLVTTLPSPTDVDPVLGQPIYSATWTGALPGRWDQWLLRAVAVPVDVVPQKGERGLPSAASDVVGLLVPPGPPELEPLSADVWGGDHRGVVVRTATTAPPRVLPAGVHRLDGSAGAQAIDSVELQAVPTTPLTSAPAAAATSPVLEQGARVAGRSPLALWFTRPVAADPVDVRVRLVDPFGREVVRELTVPGWVAPPPDVSVSIVDVFAIAGRGVHLGIVTNASYRRRPPYVLEIVAQQRLLWPLPMPFAPVPPAGPGDPGGPGGAGRVLPEGIEPGPLPPGPVAPGRRPDQLPPLLPGEGVRPGGPFLPRGPFGPPIGPPIRLPLGPRTLTGSFPLDEIPLAGDGFPRTTEIVVVRNRLRRGLNPPPPYEAFIPLAGPLRITVSIIAPDGQRVTDVHTG